MEATHELEHEHDSHQHHGESYPKNIGKIVMLISVLGGFWMIKTMQAAQQLPIPAWGVMLILAICGILIGGSSVIVPEQRGGRAATYIGFVLVAIAILMMFNGWINHAAGK